MFAMRSSWGLIQAFLATVSDADLGTILLVLAVAAFGLAIWRAVARDVTATVLLAILGVVLLVVAL